MVISLFANCCFQVLTRGTKSVFRIYDKFKTTIRESNKLQTLVERTWMQPVVLQRNNRTVDRFGPLL
jgi:hypothetical protein